MNLIEQVKTLIYKDVVLEWRSKYAINSILLYVVSTVFVCYQSFKSVDTVVWNTLFWIILLFASINAMSRSFIQETGNRHLYYYSIVSPKAIILAKIIYNSLVMILMTGIAFIVYNLIFKTEIGNLPVYLLSIFLGSISFASVFTMIAGISAKAGNNSTIMAILSFPVIIPLLIILIKLSRTALMGGFLAGSWPDIAVLLAINVVTIAISLLLFPYLWRD
ncbi:MULTISPECIES: heme exporter protein CcmB [Sphingobacterium]|uniref:Cytochrome C biogenesis protein CcmB n=1 Tax=Sphingobacterium cellulitidis TaxID=1768011 RepID=A0A8H9FX07_9SPHI|nr:MULTISPECIES: heme exporter protein CcmB [Sphingobacterium]MBA8985499.1 heme exporter protein B [Sphingobacterium soli]OYD44005.1 ABC transporter permease [Sphingobacterium cellulitidis]WFB63920.1 heme exporter protein CcmB [Sphingobacterium sp. WM]GGE09219.1 cytochrome C biogenesis protein CcmB [Sphingobacterium soli]